MNSQSLAKIQIQLKFKNQFLFESSPRIRPSQPSSPEPARLTSQAVTSLLSLASLRCLGVFAERCVPFGLAHSAEAPLLFLGRWHVGPTWQAFLPPPAPPCSAPQSPISTTPGHVCCPTLNLEIPRQCVYSPALNAIFKPLLNPALPSMALTPLTTAGYHPLLPSRPSLGPYKRRASPPEHPAALHSTLELPSLP
jgi:hypothetical protein